MVFTVDAKYDQGMTNLMTREQAAGALHLSLSTVIRMCQRGELAVVRPCGAGRGRPLFITAESVEKALRPVTVSKASERNAPAAAGRSDEASTSN